MRVSIDRDDPGYVNWRNDVRFEVYLDGAKLDKCVMADEEAGEATRIQYGEDGRPVLEADSLKRETVRGKVEIRTASLQ